MSNTPIELKGSSFTLSVVHLHDAKPEIIRQAIKDKIAEAPTFLKNAPVVLNVSHLNGNTNWRQLQRVIASSGLRVVGVSGCQDAALKADILRAGLPLLNEGKKKAPRSEKALLPAPPADVSVTQSRIVDLPVRSGQRIYAPLCDLIVTGHVSAGAELIADGNIHVYGSMRGRALAGANGNRNAQIFCSHLAAELTSIAGEYWLSEQIPVEFYEKAARLKLTDGVLTIQSLN